MQAKFCPLVSVLVIWKNISIQVCQGANKEECSEKEPTFETLEERIKQSPEEVENSRAETDLIKKDSKISPQKDNVNPIASDVLDSVYPTEVKLHKCPSCEKTFNKLYNLKVHINSIHTNPKWSIVHIVIILVQLKIL